MSKGIPGEAEAGAIHSSLPAEPDLLAVGKLLRPHGVHGEMLMEVYTDFPERLVPGIDLYLGTGQETLHLARRRLHKDGLLLTFTGYTTPEAVGRFRNCLLYVRADDRPPLSENEYYHHQLLHLHVTSDTGVPVGMVSEILTTGASDVLVVRPQNGPDVLIPIVDEFIPKVDLPAGEITVHLIPGMLPEEP
jgi:16S rRNA processing protein RimM